MLAHFFLAPSFGGSSIRLIEVAQGLNEGKSCTGLALGETLMSLDGFHRREINKFAGGPLLFQVIFPTLFNMCFSHHAAFMLYFSLKILFSLFSQHISLYSLISLFFHPSPNIANGQTEGSRLLPRILSPSILFSPTASGYSQQLVDFPNEG